MSAGYAQTVDASIFRTPRQPSAPRLDNPGPEVPVWSELL